MSVRENPSVALLQGLRAVAAHDQRLLAYYETQRRSWEAERAQLQMALQVQRNQHAAELESLRQQLPDIQRSRMLAQSEQILQLTARVTQMEASSTEQARTIAQLQQQLSTAVSEKRSLQDQLVTLSAARVQQERSIARERESKKAADAKCVELIAGLQTSVNQLKQDNAALRYNLQTQTADCANLGAKLNEANHKAAESVQKLRRLQQSYELTKSNLDKSVSDRESLSKQVTELRAELSKSALCAVQKRKCHQELQELLIACDAVTGEMRACAKQLSGEDISNTTNGGVFVAASVTLRATWNSLKQIVVKQHALAKEYYELLTVKEPVPDLNANENPNNPDVLYKRAKWFRQSVLHRAERLDDDLANVPLISRMTDIKAIAAFWETRYTTDLAENEDRMREVCIENEIQLRSQLHETQQKVEELKMSLHVAKVNHIKVENDAKDQVRFALAEVATAISLLRIGEPAWRLLQAMQDVKSATQDVDDTKTKAAVVERMGASVQTLVGNIELAISDAPPDVSARFQQHLSNLKAKLTLTGLGNGNKPPNMDALDDTIAAAQTLVNNVRLIRTSAVRKNETPTSALSGGHVGAATKHAGAPHTGSTRLHVCLRK